MIKKNDKEKIIYKLPLIILTFIFLNILITSVLFIFKIEITSLSFISSLIITIASFSILTYKQKYSIKSISIIMASFLIIVLLPMKLYSYITDLSYDANWYHKTAIGEMNLGWNPVYEDVIEFDKTLERPLYLYERADIWADHYPKAYWIFALNEYKITNSIESGKSLYFLIAVSTFILSLKFLIKKFSKKLSIVLSLLITFNPVFVYQMFSYYNDGIMGNLLILMFITLFNICNSKDNKSYETVSEYIIYFLLLCLLIDIKFSAFAFAGVYSFGIFIYMLFKKKKKVVPLMITAACAVILSVLLLGSSSYVRNFKEHGNLFYPMFGENKEDILDYVIPRRLIDRSNIERFIFSNFAGSYNSSNDRLHDHKIKIPFTFEKEELEVYKDTDVRFGGYGVLFGGILLVSGAIYLYTIIKLKKENEIMYHIPVAISVLFVFFVNGMWWARYFAILYVFPFIVMFCLKKINNKFSKISINVLTAILIVNIAIIASVYIPAVLKKSNEYNQEMADKYGDKVEIDYQTSYFYEKMFGLIFNLIDDGKKVNVIRVDKDNNVIKDFYNNQ